MPFILQTSVSLQICSLIIFFLGFHTVDLLRKMFEVQIFIQTFLYILMSFFFNVTKYCSVKKPQKYWDSI